VKIVVVGNYDRAFTMCRMGLLSGFVQAGHEVTVCAPAETAEVPAMLRSIGVGFRSIRLDRTGTNPLRDLLSFLGLIALFRGIRPDLVVNYTIKPVVYGSLAARLCGVSRIYCMITGLGYVFMGDSARQRIIRALVGSLYRKALSVNTRIFFLNSDDLALFTRLRLIGGAKEPVVINGEGIDTDYYREQPLRTSPPVFLMIARLIRDKGVYEYVEAAAILRRRYPAAQFRLLGQFDVNPTAIQKTQIEAWQRDGTIDFLGETKDVRPFLADAGVYVLPSYREGLPLTIMEAMSVGRPVVSTHAPGCRETVVDGDNGFLVPVADADALARAMERFILEPALITAMGKRGREIAEEKYDVHKVNAVIMKAMGLSDEKNL